MNRNNILLILAMAGALCAPCRAAEKKPYDVPHRSAPLAMLFSAVCPGGGQIYTQNYLRAAGFAAAVGLCGFKWYQEDRRMKDAYALHLASLNDGDYQSYLGHYEKRRQYMWWGIGVWGISLVDAYIDAHLFKFDDQSEPALVLRVKGDNVGLAMRF